MPKLSFQVSPGKGRRGAEFLRLATFEGRRGHRLLQRERTATNACGRIRQIVFSDGKEGLCLRSRSDVEGIYEVPGSLSSELENPGRGSV